MLWRSAAAVLITLIAAWGIYEAVVVPCRCDAIEHQLEKSIDTAWSVRHSYRARQIAEANAGLVNESLSRCRSDVGLLMLAASNFTLMDRHQLAVPLLEEALRYDHRPELYLALGHAQVGTGENEKALANFIKAADFAGLPVLRDVADPQVRREAYKAVTIRMASRGKFDSRELIAHGSFDIAGPLGRSTATTKSGPSPSAARDWDVINAGGRVTTKLKKLDGASVIEVVTSQAGSTLRQILAPRSQQPSVRTSVRLLVRRGQVCAGTGNRTEPNHDVCSNSTNGWQTLVSENETCPSVITWIAARSPGGAEFVVDEVSVKAVPGYPCP